MAAFLSAGRITDKKVLDAIAAWVMLLVLAGLALTFWAGQKRNAVIGPASITVDGSGRVWLLADRSIFILAADGRLLRQTTFAEIGLDPSVNAVAGLPAGGAIAGAYDTGRLYMLDADAKLLRTIDPADTPMGHLRDGIALQALADRILVAHIGHHRLLAIDGEGKVLQQAGSTDGQPSTFHFPNNVTTSDDGLLYVSDTNHQQIEVLNVDLQRAKEPIPVPAVAHYGAPVAAVRLPSGNVAVSVLDMTMRRGAVALLDPDGKFVRRLEMQEGAEPLELLVLGSDLLVCDQHAKRFQVRRFDHDGTYAGEFGDAAFLGAMREASARHRLYANLRLLGQGVALLAAIALLVVYRRSREAQIQDATAATTAPQQWGPSEQVARPGEARAVGTPPPRPLWSSLLLSALLPGLGHLNQRRNDRGALWLAGFGLVAVANGLEWFVHTHRIADVPYGATVGTTAVLVALWLVALQDVWRHEAEMRKTRSGE